MFPGVFFLTTFGLGLFIARILKVVLAICAQQTRFTCAQMPTFLVRTFNLP
jgi:hypothetical protein